MVEEQIQQNRVKASDEIFCRSCGEIIKKEAEICPHCGVRNKPVKDKSPKRHDPSQYQTSVSNNWYYGVIVSAILWVVLLFLLPEEPGESSLDILLALLMLIAWFGLPLSLYYDIQYVRGNNEKWNPDTALWVIGGFIWLVNLIVVLVYILRRKESMD
ncbi:zinc ribbon domain-containing protein [Methanococcoides sp. NM1]|uniref:zinc ribbon domain-containing protein n=1 Tax=Methanococcoides sp. NM1 TaxID=1201013 RepID=UPI001084154B|nr:zinc ribbon domain-containing protein [Methanococcoides sp. NM1]